MRHIFYLMGKSASGKDTIYEELRLRFPELRPLVSYTTRPIRAKETDGVEYHFTDEKNLQALQKAGRVIELRVYQTAHGPWAYFTADDEHIDLNRYDYLGIGTLESFRKLSEYYGKNVVLPIYIEVEDGLRLERALKRERKQSHPGYEEMCRRFLADQADFSEEKLTQAGIGKRFRNDDDRSLCMEEVAGYISAILERRPYA